MKNLKHVFYNETIRANQRLANQRLAHQKLTSQRLASQKGFASIEAILSITIFLTMLSFSLGFFGIVHSGIVNSIAARDYAFNTFNNRTYLKYHRDTTRSQLLSNQKNNFRLHLIGTEKDNLGAEFIVTERHIAFVKSDQKKKADDHRQMLEDARNKNRSSYGFNPVWIKAGYGICLNAQCKPN